MPAAASSAPAAARQNSPHQHVEVAQKKKKKGEEQPPQINNDKKWQAKGPSSPLPSPDSPPVTGGGARFRPSRRRPEAPPSIVGCDSMTTFPPPLPRAQVHGATRTALPGPRRGPHAAGRVANTRPVPCTGTPVGARMQTPSVPSPYRTQDVACPDTQRAPGPPSCHSGSPLMAVCRWAAHQSPRESLRPRRRPLDSAPPFHPPPSKDRQLGGRAAGPLAGPCSAARLPAWGGALVPRAEGGDDGALSTAEPAINSAPLSLQHIPLSIVRRPGSGSAAVGLVDPSTRLPRPSSFPAAR
ncbi:hypothetical protein CDD83_5077 [Cordyceps sp. RAO-2017]|nr:hypothetical protein CDD83_5077 [Cordyceps sp. RAO-2017]